MKTMPTNTNTNLPKRKLREFLGEEITIEKVITGTSTYGPYVLLITATDSIISSGKVVMKNAAELAGNLPATVRVVEKQPVRGQFPYLMLE